MTVCATFETAFPPQPTLRNIMASRDLYPQEILQVVLDKNCAKAQSSIPTLAILSVLAGGYIGFGYLAYLKVVSGIPHEWSGFATLLGAAVFPIALICILLGGDKLVTSNMMIMSLGRLAGRISSKMLLRNWVIVCMGTWLHFAAKNTTGRMLAIWFPVMIFVLNGFQHLVANMFVIPAGILAGANITWGQFFFNMIPVFLGNVVGGASFVGASYLYTYRDTLKDSAE